MARSSSHAAVIKRITGLRSDQMYKVMVVSANGRSVVVDAFKGCPIIGNHDIHHTPGEPVL